MEFVAIDVETANADMASICQIGLARFKDGVLVDEWSSLINPEDYFDCINVDIHGIDQSAVSSAPTLPQVFDELTSFLSGSVTVSHTHFDRISISRALEKYSLKPVETTWLDSAKVARRTWEECAWSGYGLANVCKIIGHQFKHHDALEDAKAAGQLLKAACEKTGLSVNDWIARICQPIDPSNSSSGSAVNRDGNPEGEMHGEVLVFTGSLNISRREAADLASRVGCAVSSGVTKKTSLLVVGDQDISRLSGKDKSAKHLKAEKLILNGQNIRIIKESDFKKLVDHALESD